MSNPRVRYVLDPQRCLPTEVILHLTDTRINLHYGQLALDPQVGKELSELGTDFVAPLIMRSGHSLVPSHDLVMERATVLPDGQLVAIEEDGGRVRVRILADGMRSGIDRDLTAMARYILTRFTQ